MQIGCTGEKIGDVWEKASQRVTLCALRFRRFGAFWLAGRGYGRLG